MFSSKNALFAGLLCTIASSAMAHVDIEMTLDGGILLTNGEDEDTETFIPNVRVFGYDFGEVPEAPFEIGDPGFTASAASGLTPAWRVGMQMRGNLQFWDGTASPAFTSAGVTDTLQLRFGSTFRNATGSTFDTNAMLFGPAINGSGEFHQHLQSWLLGSDGNTVPAGPGDWGAGDGVQPPEGVYLQQMRILIDNDTTLDANTIYSADFWIAYNNGVSEDAHDEAIDWVNANYVPEPATLGLLGLGGLLIGRRRR